MSESKRYFISADVAHWLKREHGATDASLLGMNMTVDYGMPAGKAYVIGPPEVQGPPRPPIKWIALENGVALRPMQMVRVDIA